jgi:hypothetical protein
MEFMLLFTGQKGAPAPEAAHMAEMGKYALELASRGILKRGAPLDAEPAAACVRVREGKALVTDGPFAESKEVLGGFWIIEAADREAATEIAGRCPHARHATVEVHLVKSRHQFGDSEKGAPFLLVFRMEPGSSDHGEAQGREMIAFGTELVRTATLFETARLADEEGATRIAVRGGRTLVTDGPFAESKEAVGGYGLVRVAGRAEAIDLATRFPHAKWGPVEVREVLFFDRV